MPIHKGTMASGFYAPTPSIVLSAATNFNQSIATLNATVSANNTSTTVKFQYSTSSSFATYTEVNAAVTPITTQSVSCYANITGLSTNTLYYFRCVATNAGGTTTSSSLSFTTWALQVYERSTSGGTTITIPTVTPTGGSAVSVSIYDVIMFGGGGGGSSVWGGGGGLEYSTSSIALSSARTVTTFVGGGGAGVSGDLTVAGNGQDTTLSGSFTTVTARKGYGASYYTSNASGGNDRYVGMALIASYDPDGSGKGYPNDAYGGSGGAGSVGGYGSATATKTTGGTGGNGVQITLGGVTVGGGAGGGGAAYESQATSGGEVQGVRGSYNTYGSGGNAGVRGTGQNGQAGYIRFRYYAASALA